MYTGLYIDGQIVDLFPESIIVTNYLLEETDNFQRKRSSESFSVVVPATLNNDRVFNTFHNAAVVDNTPGEVHANSRECTIVHEGVEIFKGKALLVKATKKNGRPYSYTLDLFGNNGDWILPAQDLTLLDCVNPTPHAYSGTTIINSWYHDGSDPNQDYVYAPVRYRTPFANNDTVVEGTMMKPSLFVFWLIWRGFVKLGYLLESSFMNTPFFRRLVMPWVWDNFLQVDEGIKEVFAFKATGTPVNPALGTGVSKFQMAWNDWMNSYNIGGVINNGLSFEMGYDTPPYGFDPTNQYTYDSLTGMMRWICPTHNFGTLDMEFKLTIAYAIRVSRYSNASIWADFYKNSVLYDSVLIGEVEAGHGVELLNHKIAPNGGEVTKVVTDVAAGDIVECRLRYSGHKTQLGSIDIMVCARSDWHNFGGTATGGLVMSAVEASYIELVGVKRTLGSNVYLKNFSSLKNYKFLDFLAGIIDTFNLLVQTDPVSRKVIIEPAHNYRLNTIMNGYYDKSKRIVMDNSLDERKDTDIELFSDNERDYRFVFKKDNSDGGCNKYIGRNNIDPCTGKYLFPNRFRKGIKEHENRFFSPVMHYMARQWMDINGRETQLIAIIPENVSNTSARETMGNFVPKLAYYAGFTEPNGGFRFRAVSGGVTNEYVGQCPFMYAVNYHPEGVNSIPLSYGDQRVAGTVVEGLMKRFFLPRLAIMRNGKLLKAWLHLDNNFVSNWFHREALIIKEGMYFLVNISGYSPEVKESAHCEMWQYAPVEQKDIENSFPSTTQLINGTDPEGEDIKYAECLLFETDIPQ